MAYSLSTHYAGQALIDGFNFFTGNDPNNGFVDYQSKQGALDQGLVSFVGGGHSNSNSNSNDEDMTTPVVRLGVDATNNYTVPVVSNSKNNDMKNGAAAGRPSVRLTSRESFTHGLFVADFAHMPASTCGTWPAFWAYNTESWPAGGELAIIEGANRAHSNLYSAYTSEGCHLEPQSSSSSSSSSSANITGIPGPNPSCGGSDDDSGPCTYASPPADTAAYGDAFNAEGGGVYAWEWDSDAMRLWHFPRSMVPRDIAEAGVGATETPDPAGWGAPQAVFGTPRNGGCEVDRFFYNMSLAIYVNFCGDYAGANWGQADQCGQLADTCEEWVARNPESFASSYWDINYIDVYTKGKPFSNNKKANNKINKGVAAKPTATVATSFRTMSPITRVVPSGTRTITLSSVTLQPTPVASDGSSVDPAVINRSSLLGCFGSASGFEGFVRVEKNNQDTSDSGSDSSSSGNMRSAVLDNGDCVDSCDALGKRYAASYNGACWCSDRMGDAAAAPLGECNIPCPSNDEQFCGGYLDVSSSPSATPGATTTIKGEEGGTESALTTADTATIHVIPPHPTPRPDSAPAPAAASSPASASLPSSADDLSNSSKSNDSSASPGDPRILLTIYGALEDAEPPAPAPPMGGRASASSPIRGQAGKQPQRQQSTLTTEVVTAYTTVCPTDPAKLEEATYTATVFVVGEVSDECGCGTQDQELQQQQQQQQQSQQQGVHESPRPPVVVTTGTTGLGAGGGEGGGGGPPPSAAEPAPATGTTALQTTTTTHKATAAATTGQQQQQQQHPPVAAVAPTTAITSSAMKQKSPMTLTMVIPMTTYTQTCRGCGPSGESVVALTVPQDLFSSPSSPPAGSTTTTAAAALGTDDNGRAPAPQQQQQQQQKQTLTRHRQTQVLVTATSVRTVVPLYASPSSSSSSSSPPLPPFPIPGSDNNAGCHHGAANATSPASLLQTGTGIPNAALPVSSSSSSSTPPPGPGQVMGSPVWPPIHHAPTTTITAGVPGSTSGGERSRTVGGGGGRRGMGSWVVGWSVVVGLVVVILL